MTNFSSLPREIRDQIYTQVLANPLPIQFSNVLGLMVCDPDLLGPMAMLFAWASNLQIADEACAIFYQCNAFSVDCQDLPMFIGGNVHKMLSINVSGFPHERSFDNKDWIRSLHVVIEQDNTTHSRYLAYELRYLLECPRLQKLTIKTGQTTVISWEKEWTGVLKELELKLGKELEVIYAETSLDLEVPR